MPLRFLDDSGYRGMDRDLASWLLSAGEVYDSLNIIYDRPGMARQRGAHAALSALGSVASFGTSLGFVAQGDATPLLELFAVNGKTGTLLRVNRATGGTTSLGALAGTATIGRAVQHFGFTHFPGMGNVTGGFLVDTIVTPGCATAPGVFTNSVAVTMAAGNATLTLGGADTTANIRAGMYVQALLPGSAYYLGRVVAVTGGTTFTIWPVPTTAYTIAIGQLSTACALTHSSAVCGASFQNRLCFGNVVNANNGLIYDRRLIYSVLPTEEPLLSGGQQLRGASWLFNNSFWPLNNFIDVPGTDPFVGMEPVDDNELLILSTRRPVVLRGNLVTQTGVLGTQQVTFDVTELNVNASCGSDHSIQRTPIGIMWAGTDGVFNYANGGVENVLAGKMETYWRQLARSSTFAIHGSAYIRGHYLVTFTSGGSNYQLLVGLHEGNYSFAPLSNCDVFAAVPNPKTPSEVYALRWWDQTGAAPNFTNGQCIRLEGIFDPAVLGGTKVDADNTNVQFNLTTRVLAGDPSLQKIFQRGTIRYQLDTAAFNPPVSATTGIDSADAGLGAKQVCSLSVTTARGISAATNATPIVITTPTTGGAQVGDYIDVSGVAGNLNANGRWRISALTATQITLQGSSGSGAYTSGGTWRGIPETDFGMQDNEEGQGVYFTITSSGAVANFELHGLRIAHFLREPVMSA